MKFFTPAKLGPTRSKTPEGFLVCEGVRVARIGEMIYGPEEIGLEPGPDGLVRLGRTASDLFAADALASFEGKPVLGEHVEATPENWRELAWGHMQNVRAGGGGDAGYMLADLVIQSADGIAAIESGREEVSLFYEFDFVPTGKGSGRQTNIRGNHLAIVEAGRCGPTCRIGDHQPTRNPIMKLPFWGRAAAAALKAGDEETAAELIHAGMQAGDAQPDPLETRLKAQDERIDKLSALVEKLVAKDEDKEDPDKEEAGDEDEEESEEDGQKAKAGDSASIKAEWRQVASLSEILAPGCPARLPAMDAKMTAKGARDAMCKARRAAMDHAMGTEQGRAVLQPLLQGRALDAIPCGEQAVLFAAAAEMARQRNNLRIGAGDADAGGALFAPSVGDLYQSMYGRH